MTYGVPMINAVLRNRLKSGKEDPNRVRERYGEASIKRPDGVLMWVHA